MKIEKVTPEKPEIIAMAAALKLDSDEVFGKLFRIWAWADDQTIAGGAMNITESFLDKKAGKRGFSVAMRAVGWLAGNDGSLVFPGFERHNGATAKERAETNRRVANHRECNRQTVTKTVTNPLQKPLPEKRREESNTPLPPDGGEWVTWDESLIEKIKSLRKRWGPGPALDSKDARIYRRNRAGWAAYTESDWEVVAEFMRIRLAEGGPYFQPELLGKALEMPGGLLADARDWKGKQRPAEARSNVVPMPAAPTDEDREAIAEFLKCKIKS